jgi:DASH complex subunit DAD3
MASETPEAQALGLDTDNETLSPLEQEVLDDYARLLGNLNNVRLQSTSNTIPFANAHE